jgi:hypothetical protein
MATGKPNLLKTIGEIEVPEPISYGKRGNCRGTIFRFPGRKKRINQMHARPDD